MILNFYIKLLNFQKIYLLFYDEFQLYDIQIYIKINMFLTIDAEKKKSGNNQFIMIDYFKNNVLIS